MNNTRLWHNTGSWDFGKNISRKKSHLYPILLFRIIMVDHLWVFCTILYTIVYNFDVKWITAISDEGAQCKTSLKLKAVNFQL